ncbi:MAG: electron transfer flavoprotein subunit alpha/FixB family protein [Desulfobacteraceae bacterium]|nr:MAG: electron transfer flavoprotein subunit alpha/FixB family protein [Desulfobacteraceae bacterium]
MAAMRKPDKKIIFIIAEHHESRTKSIVFELAACADKIKKFCPAEIKVIILESETEKLSFEITRATGLDAVAIEINELALYNAEIYKTVINDLAEEYFPSFIVIGHTARGLDVASGLAVRMKAACITGVEGLSEAGGRLCFKRQMFFGKINAHIAAGSEPLIITVQPGSFEAYKPDSANPGRVETRRVECFAELTRATGIRRCKFQDSSISEAKVIISAGNGIGEKENLDLIYRMADVFPGSTVGGSRILVDRGWLEYRQQVGLTGARVAPELYIACGISGASQHLAGMRDAGFVVSINKDPGAAIFNESDVCIVEDLKKFIPAFLEEYGKREI